VWKKQISVIVIDELHTIMIGRDGVEIIMHDLALPHTHGKRAAFPDIGGP
jgi:replicative superfamily II helicase